MHRHGQLFFFQAEDGIRDHCVTGVQTCALPISGDGRLRAVPVRAGRVGAGAPGREIGRASCRERVYIWVVAESLKKKDLALREVVCGRTMLTLWCSGLYQLWLLRDRD